MLWASLQCLEMPITLIPWIWSWKNLLQSHNFPAPSPLKRGQARIWWSIVCYLDLARHVVQLTTMNFIMNNFLFFSSPYIRKCKFNSNLWEWGWRWQEASWEVAFIIATEVNSCTEYLFYLEFSSNWLSKQLIHGNYNTLFILNYL